MIRKIINIDEEKCDGCGICVTACHEGAIDIVDGKAKLARENFCDGLGDCLPACPQDAIKFVTREAPEYDEELVKKNMAEKKKNQNTGCPGSKPLSLNRSKVVSTFITSKNNISNKLHKNIDNSTTNINNKKSELNQWPIQIKLLPTMAEFYDNAKLLVAADCCAYTYANFHNDFMKDKITLIGCPKLDSTDYSDKLAEIIKFNNLKSITVAKMEVPCCYGLQKAVEEAIKKSGKILPYNIVTITRNAEILID